MPKSTGPLQTHLFGSNSTNSTPGMTDQPTVTADKIGANKDTNAIPQGNPSILSSAGAIGKQFNPDGAIGQIPQAVGGPFSKDGVIGSQFDAGQDGIAGHVERAVDGPSNPAGSGKKA